jgi:anti-sigma B factor antagonist
MTGAYSKKSTILLIRLHGGLPGRPPSFSYLGEGGVEEVLSLPTKYPVASPTEPRKGLLSRWLRRKATPEFVEGNAALPNVVESELDKGVREYIIDLEEVHWINSTGLGCLVAVWVRILKCNGALVLVTTSPRVLEVFEITKLDNIFTFAESIEKAVLCSPNPDPAGLAFVS